MHHICRDRRLPAAGKPLKADALRFDLIHKAEARVSRRSPVFSLTLVEADPLGFDLMNKAEAEVSRRSSALCAIQRAFQSTSATL